MGAADSVKPNEKPETRWHLSLIPLYMAIGSPGLLVTLAALSLGANVADIGVMTAAGAAASIVLSAVWGGLSDFSGRRKGYLLLFFIILGPIFLALSMANSVPQLILLYTVLVSIASGVTPIAVMYTVECCKGKNWQGGVARYNSIISIGNILGLLTYTVMAQFYEMRWLFYIAAAMCFLAVILLWKTGHEPEITLERQPFQVRILRYGEKFFSPKPILHYLDIRRSKIPKNLKHLKSLQLLFLAAFVHWVGITFFAVGQTPLMKALGLSDSLILAVSCAAGATQAIAFVRIAPRINSDNKRLLNRVVVIRGSLILCWAALPIFFFYPTSFVFIFPLIISIVWSIFYAMIWLPITTFAISEASADRKGSVQGQLLSAVGVGNAIGSALGGLVITAYGYTVGFVLASIIAMLAIPIISRIEIID
jgi:MFS family permease